MANRPADRAAVAHDRVCDDALRVVQDAVVLGDDRGCEHIRMPGHGADVEGLTIYPDAL